MDGFEDCPALLGRGARSGQRLLAEGCSTSYEFRTKACKKRLQLSIHCEHSVKNEAVMQAGTQSTRERKTQASLGSGQKMPRLEAQGFYSIGGEFPFYSYYPTLPCVSDHMRFLSFSVSSQLSP